MAIPRCWQRQSPTRDEDRDTETRPGDQTGLRQHGERSRPSRVCQKPRDNLSRDTGVPVWSVLAPRIGRATPSAGKEPGGWEAGRDFLAP